MADDITRKIKLKKNLTLKMRGIKELMLVRYDEETGTQIKRLVPK